MVIALFVPPSDKQMALDEYSYALNGSYAWLSNGILWKNGSNSIGTDKGCYGAGDTVGCGIDLANRKIFFTKNGIRLDTADLRLYLSIPSDVNQLFPFVSLCDSDDKIETNFGPNFIAITPTTSKIVPINPEIVSTMLTTMTSIITPINLRIKLKTIRVFARFYRHRLCYFIVRHMKADQALVKPSAEQSADKWSNDGNDSGNCPEGFFCKSNFICVRKECAAGDTECCANCAEAMPSEQKKKKR
ncbi:hypothetical protein niasHT_034352 [Heterodera trifolii]|uniref:B30.2/SPRY domain-containing protein n=1 Tax=Heterodera trifolii TaxID=157864 RepID=A0ABD2HUK8_9BILA